VRRSAAQLKFIITLTAALWSFSVLADAPQNGTCGKTANQIDFNVDGMKDYSVGRDLLNNGGGWYFTAQGGEIVVPSQSKDGQLCVQNGTRPSGQGSSNRDNSAGPQKCGSAIDGTRKVQVEDSSGALIQKEYLWTWVKDQSGDGGYLRITPLDANGKPENPMIKVSGNASTPPPGSPAGTKPQSGISVSAMSVPTAGSGATAQDKTLVDIPEADNVSSGSTPVVCTIGKVSENDKKSRSWDKDKGLVENDDNGGAGDGKTVAVDTSQVAR